MKKNIEINNLGCQFKGYLCIKPYTSYLNNKLLEDLSKMFYYLNVSEYDAFLVGDKKFNNLTKSKLFLEISDNAVDAIDYFQERYFNILSDKEDIVDMISNCILKVHNNEKPENQLEASIMYDICCIAHLEELDVPSEKKQEREQECINLLQNGNREKIIQQYNIEQSTDNKKMIYLENEFTGFLMKDNPLHKLSIEERENNPKLVLFLCSRNSDEIYDYTKYATNELRKYCIENKYNLYNNEIYREGATIIFGEDFWRKLGIEKEYIEQEDTEYNDYTEEQENQYNSTDISSNDTFNQNYQDFNNDEPEL